MLPKIGRIGEKTILQQNEWDFEGWEGESKFGISGDAEKALLVVRGKEKGGLVDGYIYIGRSYIQRRMGVPGGVFTFWILPKDQNYKMSVTFKEGMACK